MHTWDLQCIRRYLGLENVKLPAQAWCPTVSITAIQFRLNLQTSISPNFSVSGIDWPVLWQSCHHLPCFLLHSLPWLAVKFRIDFNTRLLTYKTRCAKQPVYLQTVLATSLPSHQLRSHKRITLSVPGVKTNAGSRVFHSAPLPCGTTSCIKTSHWWVWLFLGFCHWTLIWLSHHWAWPRQENWCYRSLIDWLIDHHIPIVSEHFEGSTMVIWSPIEQGWPIIHIATWERKLVLNDSVMYYIIQWIVFVRNMQWPEVLVLCSEGVVHVLLVWHYFMISGFHVLFHAHVTGQSTVLWTAVCGKWQCAGGGSSPAAVVSRWAW